MTKIQKDKMTKRPKRQMDKKTKHERPKREFNIVMLEQFRTLAMFLISTVQTPECKKVYVVVF